MKLDRLPSAPPLTAEERAAISRRAVDAAVQVAAAHGIKVSEPAVLAERYALRVHLKPAPLVARVSTFTALLRQPIEPWLARELDVTAFLHGQGAPVVAPTELLPPGPFLQDGFAISFWTYVAPVSDELPSPERAGKMMAELHQAMRAYPGELPLLAPPLSDIPRGLARLEQLPQVLPANELAMLHRVADRLVPEVGRLEAPMQALHGDAHIYNMIRSSRGFLWNDFEDTCRGPVEWDLNGLADPEGQGLAAYTGTWSMERLELLRQVRLLQAVVWVLALLPEVDEFAVQARDMLQALRPLA